MCRNIRKLRDGNRIPPQPELRDAALQFVRKISGYRSPSQKNKIAFEQAVEEVTSAAERLFRNLHTKEE